MKPQDTRGRYGTNNTVYSLYVSIRLIQDSWSFVFDKLHTVRDGMSSFKRICLSRRGDLDDQGLILQMYSPLVILINGYSSLPFIHIVSRNMVNMLTLYG